MRSPLPHQIPVLKYLESHRQAFLGMDKRTGKTYCAIYWAIHHGASKVLVVAPLSAIPGWLNEIEMVTGETAWDLTSEHNHKLWVKQGNRLPGRWFICNSQSLFRPGRGSDPSPRETAL